MFTGIITDVGEVAEVARRGLGMRARIRTRYDVEGIALGASIACGGPCLTVVERGRDDGTFDVEISAETLARTNLADWRPGTRVNLERPLKASDELGGHIVTGHVDGVAFIEARSEESGMARLRLRAPSDLSRFIAEKGSVALDGTSLTVNAVDGDLFEIMLIPHTLKVTTWGERREGDCVNLEVDLFARYLDRLAGASLGVAPKGASE